MAQRVCVFIVNHRTPFISGRRILWPPVLRLIFHVQFVQLTVIILSGSISQHISFVRSPLLVCPSFKCSPVNMYVFQVERYSMWTYAVSESNERLENDESAFQSSCTCSRLDSKLRRRTLEGCTRVLSWSKRTLRLLQDTYGNKTPTYFISNKFRFSFKLHRNFAWLFEKKKKNSNLFPNSNRVLICYRKQAIDLFNDFDWMMFRSSICIHHDWNMFKILLPRQRSLFLSKPNCQCCY